MIRYILAVVLLSAPALAQDAADTVKLEPIAGPAALASFFEARAKGGSISVLHLGDSHIARDTFSGDLRDYLADGEPGGRGLLPPGLVYPFVQLRGVEIDASDGWGVARARDEAAEGPFGLMSARAVASAGTSPTITLSGFEFPADRLLVGYWRQPDGGVMQMRVDEEVQAIPTAGVSGPAFAAFPIPEDTQIVRLMPAGDGPVAIFSLLLEGDAPGIVLSNAGWPGATAEIMARWEDDVLQLELERLDPDLIIVSYGTNEGFDDDLDLPAYRVMLAAQLGRLKRLAPDASLLLTGGPDGTRLPFYADTDAREPDEWACAALSNVERTAYAALIEAESETLLRWHDPPQLNAVLKAQKEVAAQMGAAHWDWRAAMGGTCSVHEWRLAEDPQLARADHVHLTGDGYALSARWLMDALNGAFVAWQRDREAQPVP